jgi:hypothetical protein
MDTRCCFGVGIMHPETTCSLRPCFAGFASIDAIHSSFLRGGSFEDAARKGRCYIAVGKDQS